MQQKRVLLVIIDALSSEYTVPAVKSGELSTLSRLAELGDLREESVSIFPSLTPAATSTIATGAYPNSHGIFGFHWYSREEEEEAYHGDDFWVIAGMGFANFFEGCLQKLNGARLRVPTIFQKLKKAGKRSACLNFLIYKGETEHQAKVPAWFNWHPDIPKTQTVGGPDVLFFGDLVDGGSELSEDAPERAGGLLGRFGFNDDNTGRVLEHLAETDCPPDFSIAYFPDHDYKAHEVGLEKAFAQVKKVDKYLERFVLKHGGMEEFLKEYAVVITGDHSQSDVLEDANQASIRLDKLFPADKLSKPGNWNDQSKLKVCPDMRCAQLYRTAECDLSDQDIVKILLSEERVDQVVHSRVGSDGEFAVHTADRGVLRFSLGDQNAMATDSYGNHWKWEGELSAVDARVEQGQLLYGDYPNALERIANGAGGLSAGDFWVTARLGCEFALKETSVHVGGGSHGSLHRLDSLSPLIAAGLPDGVELPEHPRLVDVAPLCLRILGE